MKTRAMVTVALLIAISVILTRVFGIMLPVAGVMSLRISFGEIPIYLSGILFGPFAGAAAGAIADVIGVTVAGLDFFPGFTISAALAGFIPGLMLHSRRHHLTFLRLLITLALAGLIVTLLNTYWVVVLYRAGALAILPARLLSRAVMIPVHSGLVWLLLTRGQLIRE